MHAWLANSARAKLKCAVSLNDPEKVLEAAVRIIQSTWRVRRAELLLKKLRDDKRHLILESAARKIQRLFRVRKHQRAQKDTLRAIHSPGVRVARYSPSAMVTAAPVKSPMSGSTPTD